MGTLHERELTLKERLRIIVFGTDTKAGKRFDVALLWLILISVLIVVVETIPAINAKYGKILRILEWAFTILFTIEYIVRIWIAKYPFKYVTGFYGIIDLLAIVPTYLSLILVGSQALTVVRALRFLRVFRILKLLTFIGAAQRLILSLKNSAHKLTVFLGFVLTLVIMLGSLMYLIEGGKDGFESIPKSIYWAIVTITTVGYGDIVPHTPLGQILASVIMLLGYAIIAVPTGIVTLEMTKSSLQKEMNHRCTKCGQDVHDNDSIFCKTCGEKL